MDSLSQKTSGITSDLTHDKGWKMLTGLGYGVVRQIAVDATWSAVRFKHKEMRKEPSHFGIDMPGIDRATKMIAIPGDLEQVLQEAGIAAFFRQMAFTHQKEFVVAVLEAKRPETRARRIRKIADQVKALAVQKNGE